MPSPSSVLAPSGENGWHVTTFGTEPGLLNRTLNLPDRERLSKDMQHMNASWTPFLWTIKDDY